MNDQMSEEIIVCLLSGFFTILGTIISVIASYKSMANQLDKRQAITDVKIENLTTAVNKHNNFAERLPILEEKMKVANHRLDDLEKELK